MSVQTTESQIKKIAKEIADSIKNTPADWSVWRAGVYVKHNSLYSFIAYQGQGLDENVYNNSYEDICEFDYLIENEDEYTESTMKEMIEDDIVDFVDSFN